MGLCLWMFPEVIFNRKYWLIRLISNAEENYTTFFAFAFSSAILGVMKKSVKRMSTGVDRRPVEKLSLVDVDSRRQADVFITPAIFASGKKYFAF